MKKFSVTIVFAAAGLALQAAIVLRTDFAGAWDRGAWCALADGSALLSTNRFSGATAFVAETSFGERPASSIVLTSDSSDDNPDDRLEAIVDGTGLSLRRHRCENGRIETIRLAGLSARYEPREPYALTVVAQPSADSALDVRVCCDGHVFDCRIADFPRVYRAGIGTPGGRRAKSFAAATYLAEIARDERPQYLRLVRVNQVGYAARAPKRAEVPTELPFTTFTVQKLTPAVTWEDVYTGSFTPAEGFYKYADFSCVTNPGDYRVVCGDAPRIAGNIRDKVGAYSSNWFKIYDGVYDSLQRVLFGFYTWQRCGSPKGWAGLCHQERVPLVGTDRFFDIRGGYHQSDDLRCWADDTARAVWLLFLWAERADFAWDDGAIAEELRWGAAYFEKLVGEKGYAWDCQFEPIGWGPRNYYATPAPMAAQFCVLHVLCRAARYFKTRDAAFAVRCRAKAEAVMRELETNPFFDKPYVPPTDIPPGSQPAAFYSAVRRGTPASDAAFVSAAIELYEATEKDVYRAKADAYGERMLGSRSALDYTGCCGIRDFMRFAPFRAFALTGHARYKELLRRECEAYVLDAADLQDNRDTHEPVAKGIVLMEGYRIFRKREYLVAAQRDLDWVLGVNRHEQSFVNGVGRNTQPHEAWGQFFPSTPFIPGAVVHMMDGEYNLPNAGILLLLAQRLNGL